MGMKIVNKPIAWPVVYLRPGDGGETERYEFDARFARPVTVEEWNRLAKPSTDDQTPVRDVLARYLKSLDEVEIDGRARGEDTDDAIALCDELVGLESALYQSLLGSVWGIRLGNLPTPPATGQVAIPQAATTGAKATSKPSASRKSKPVRG